MTLLTISQNIAKTTKSEVPETIIDNTQEIAKQIFQSVRLATKDVFERYDWQVLQYDKSFNSAVGTAQYDLPDDFDRIINTTFFNSTQQREVFMVTPREWRIFNLNASQSIVIRYRIRQNKTEFTPTPTAIEAFIYEYISNLIILDNNGTTTYTDWQADNDTSLLNEDLIELQATWRFLKIRGKDYAEEQREAEDRLRDVMGRDAGRKRIYPTVPNYTIYNNTLRQEITP